MHNSANQLIFVCTMLTKFLPPLVEKVCWYSSLYITYSLSHCMFYDHSWWHYLASAVLKAPCNASKNFEVYKEEFPIDVDQSWFHWLESPHNEIMKVSFCYSHFSLDLEIINVIYIQLDTPIIINETVKVIKLLACFSNRLAAE